MQYFGGKHHIAKQLAEVIGPVARQRGVYVEPFVGGASMTVEIDCQRRVCSDINRALITMWKAVLAGWEPPEHVSELEYNRVKKIKDHNDPLTAFVGFGCSFAAKWFGGYARGSNENYAAAAANSIKRKAARLSGVEWSSSDYTYCPTPDGAVIYCDPPYADTTGYGAVRPFYWTGFYQWCQKKHKEGCVVFVSEYKAPLDIFKVCFEVEVKTSVRNTTGETRIEKLFVLRDQML